MVLSCRPLLTDSIQSRSSICRWLAELPRASSRQDSAAILSSIEFDRDAEFFATAGVSKRISIYDFAAVLDHSPYSDVHCPASELITRSKLSCLSWNRRARGKGPPLHCSGLFMGYTLLP